MDCQETGAGGGEAVSGTTPLKPKEGLNGAPVIREGLVECFPTAKGVFVDLHVDAFASEFYALHAEAEALFGCGFTL
jgi:hypothetical protein